MTMTIRATPWRGCSMAAPPNGLPEVLRYNISRRRPVSVVTGGKGPGAAKVRWGFVPHWYRDPSPTARLLITARAETIAEKPPSAPPCFDRRCLIGASASTNGRGTHADNRLPVVISFRKTARPLVFAGTGRTAAGTRRA